MWNEIAKAATLHDGAECFVWAHGWARPLVAEFCKNENGGVFVDGGGGFYGDDKPTHYMEILFPEPPKEAE